MTVKRLGRAFLAMVMAVVVMVSGLPIPVSAETTYPARIRDLAKRDYDGRVVILHSNDVHGAIDGYAKMAAMADFFEDRGAEVIMVDAGDFSQGSPYVNGSKGANAITMMNKAGYDIAAIGDHEFDFGYERLKKNLKKAKFKVLCANVKQNGKNLCKPRMTVTTGSDLTIGFFGLDTPEAKANPNLTKELHFLSGKKMYACARKQVRALRKNDADFIVALTHLGVDDEAAPNGNRSIDLYDHVKGIDVIIDGHSHTVMTTDMDGNLIQSAGANFDYIGVIEIGRNKKVTNHYLVSTKGLKQKAKVKKAAKKIAKRVNSR